MKKTILIACVLLVAVVSTACINNFAVQDLNNKALEFMEKGDYTQAIERLKSSLDLDSSIFETHYNLAVAYTEVQNYSEAVNEFKKALEIKPNSAEVYYSLATAENNLAVDIEQGKVRADEENGTYIPDAGEISDDYKPSEFELKLVSDLKSAAVENYKKHLELDPNSENKATAQEMIENLSKKQSELNE